MSKNGNPNININNAEIKNILNTTPLSIPSTPSFQPFHRRRNTQTPKITKYPRDGLTPSPPSRFSPLPKKKVSAGMLFTNDKVILAGYQRKWWDKKETKFLSGFGGSQEGNESYLRTAIRETLEELYEFFIIPKNNRNNKNKIKINCDNLQKASIPENILLEIEQNIPYTVEDKTEGKSFEYVFFKYNFEDLTKILKIVHKHLNLSRTITSLVYPEKLPLTIEELIFEREDKCLTPEVISICLLPVDEMGTKNIIKSDIRSDIDKLCALRRMNT